jgi:hypothetical protein
MLLVMGLGPRFPDFPLLLLRLCFHCAFCAFGCGSFVWVFLVNYLQNVGIENWKWVLNKSVLKGGKWRHQANRLYCC